MLVASDRIYYNRMQACGLAAAVGFLAHTSEQRIRLAGDQMRIGQRSPARVLAADGTWFISDPGSANGTFVNSRELAVGEVTLGTILRGAILRGAILHAADLDGADLTHADLLGARWPEGARVPEGWMVDGESGRLEKRLPQLSEVVTHYP